RREQWVDVGDTDDPVTERGPPTRKEGTPPDGFCICLQIVEVCKKPLGTGHVQDAADHLCPSFEHTESPASEWLSRRLPRSHEGDRRFDEQRAILNNKQSKIGMAEICTGLRSFHPSVEPNGHGASCHLCGQARIISGRDPGAPHWDSGRLGG